MKVIRLTDTRYILDAGTSITSEGAAQLGDAWRDWWEKEDDPPTVLIVGGSKIPLEYEDHRDPDAIQMSRIEEKLDRIWDALS